MKRITHILLFGMVLALSPMLYAQHPAQPDENFHIYLCFGQSNMEGCGPIEVQDTMDISNRFLMMAAVDTLAFASSTAFSASRSPVSYINRASSFFTAISST